MATRAIKPKHDDSLLTGWESVPEKAPSVVIEAQPTFTRFLALFGLLLTFIGVFAQLAPATRFNYMVTPGWGIVLLTMGLALLLLHAFSEKEEQFRKVYAGAGLFVMGASAILRFIPGTAGSYFLPVGLPGLGLGLLVVSATLRHETDEKWRRFLTTALLIFTGVILAGGILLVCLYKQDYVGEGVLLMILGLIYAMVTMAQLPEKQSYTVGVGLTLLGVFCVGVSLIGCWTATSVDAFLVPSGFSLIVLGLIYCGIGLGVVSDWPLIVLTRRELAAIFYSPVAYPVLFGLMFIALIQFTLFLSGLGRMGAMPEPIVFHAIYDFVPLVAQMFIVPILTMRLLSEEERAGTLEVLLTAPVNEVSVVLSKFFAVLIFYVLTWFPYWVYLVSLRVAGGSEFDYRPLLSHGVVLIASGSCFMAMGMFCSSLTRNQIIAAVFTFAGMMVFVIMIVVKNIFKRTYPALDDVLTPFSFFDLWESAARGLVIPRYLMIQVSLAVFFLFLSIKVLESRKWK